MAAVHSHFARHRAADLDQLPTGSTGVVEPDRTARQAEGEQQSPASIEPEPAQGQGRRVTLRLWARLLAHTQKTGTLPQ